MPSETKHVSACFQVCMHVTFMSVYKRHIWVRSAVLWDVRCCCVCVCLSWSSEWHQLLKIAAAHLLLFSTPGPAQAITTHARRRSPNHSLFLTHRLLGWISWENRKKKRQNSNDTKRKYHWLCLKCKLLDTDLCIEESKIKFTTLAVVLNVCWPQHTHSCDIICSCI